MLQVKNTDSANLSAQTKGEKLSSKQFRYGFKQTYHYTNVKAANFDKA